MQLPFFVAMLLVLGLSTGLAAHSVAFDTSPTLSSLKGDDAAQLKREIAENLKSSMQKGRLTADLRFVRYRLQKGENFYTVVTRLSQDPDTLASLNDIAHPDEVTVGKVLLVPNARGVFRESASTQDHPFVIDVSFVTDMQSKPNQKSVQKPVVLYFYPGRRFSSAERDFFRGVVFRHPLPGARQSSGFGWRKDPIHGGQSLHSGIDLAAATGTSVQASETGKVIFAGKKGGYGNAILIKHDYGYVTLYGHLSKFSVKKGDQVRRGQMIGQVGQTGRVTGPHLHFEVLKEGKRRRPVFDVSHR